MSVLSFSSLSLPVGFFNEYNINVLISSFIIFLIFILHRKLALINKLLYHITKLIRDIYMDSVHEYNQNHISFLSCVFLFLFFSNFISLIIEKKSFAHNSIMTFVFSLFCFSYVVIEGLRKKGWGFFNLFIPKGVPKLIVPFIFIVEFFSFTLRIFTLTIRLLMNVSIGHLILDIMYNLSLSHNSLEKIIGIFLSVVVYFVELLSCIMQAYIFVIMLSNYFSDVLSKDH